MRREHDVPAVPALTKPPGTSWHDHLCMLLQVGSEIEHALLVQYLYAAYSLGGDQVPPKHRSRVLRWQDILLTVAREEMGHLISVQNLLTLLGGPVCYARRDFPFDSKYFPAPFRLERLSLDSMAAYVYAEMPPGLEPPARGSKRGATPKARAERRVLDVAKRKRWHHVGTIYDEIQRIVAAERPFLIPDSAFRTDSYAVQASPDEWSKGYRPEAKDTNDHAGLDPKVRRPWGRDEVPRTDRSATVIVAQMGTRQQVLAALAEIAGQGESLRPTPVASQETEPSHFERFLVVYEGLEVAEREGWNPCRDVPVNPTTRDDPAWVKGRTVITSRTSRTWADLFNLRYRMALLWLTHIFRLASSTEPSQRRLRGVTLHRVFGEMYNMKSIAGVLMRSPLTDEPGDPRRAGPPFEMPWSLDLPASDADCWRLHRELLGESLRHCARLLDHERSPEAVAYATTLRAVDRQAVQWIDQVLAGLGAGRKGV